MLNIILSVVFASSGAILILLAGIILRENPRSRINRITSAMLFFAGIGPVSATIYYALILPSGKELSPLVYNIFYLWEFFFPSFILFTAVFPVEHRSFRRHPKLFYAGFIPHLSHILLIMLFSDPNKIVSALTIKSDFPVFGILLDYFGYVLRLVGVLFGLILEAHVRFFSVVNLIYIVIAGIFLFQGYRSVNNPRLKKQARIIIFGISTAVIFYIASYMIPTIFVLQFNTQLKYLMIIIGLVLGPGFIAWAILKHRFLDIRLIVRQSLVYSVSSAFVIGLYLLIIKQFGKILTSIFGGGIAVLEIAVIVLALLFFQPVLNFVDGVLRRLFIKGGADFSVVLEDFSRKIITLLDFDKLLKETLRTFKDELLIENVYFAVPSDEGSCNVYYADRGESVIYKRDRVLESFLIVRGFNVTYDEIPMPALSKETRDLLKLNDTKILIPLINAHKLLGYVSLGRKASGLGYNAEDMTTFKVLANQLVVAVNNAKLYKESLERQRLEEELALARQIQRQLLPKTLPSSEKLHFAAYSEPSREVGGDYFDFITTSAGRLAMCIGDASGKGIPAALLIARLQAMIHSAAQGDLEINKKMELINNLLSSSGMPDRYITFFYGEIDIQQQNLHYCNAGHNYPILFRNDGTEVELKEGGILIGAFENMPYEYNSIRLQSGDLLVCYTDGVTEAMNTDEEEFGESSLKRVIADNREVPPGELQKIVLGKVRDHCDGEPLQDDCTLLIMKVV